MWLYNQRMNGFEVLLMRINPSHVAHLYIWLHNHRAAPNRLLLDNHKSVLVNRVRSALI